MEGLTRRQLGGVCAAVALSGGNAKAQPSASTVELPQGGSAPALGQGSWHLAQGRHPAAEEQEALRTGISLGLTLIDTAEVYSNGRAEEMVGRVIAGQRDKVFLVSKVAPYHATANGIPEACAASLKRLGTDHLDIYLLHRRGDVSDLSVVVDSFESLRAKGRIRHWGVSNFRVADMEDLFRVRGGDACATNQVRYSLTDRSIEPALLPWCERHGVPIMAYSPLGNGNDLLKNSALMRVADRHGSNSAAVALTWTMRSGHVISIPESGNAAHVRQNAAALSLRLTAQDLADLDRAFPT
jgi:diketogulonate reductase-like aldo/keto reductase